MVRRWIETSAWLMGLLLVLFYGVSRAWSERARVEGIEAFRQIEAAHPEALRLAAADSATPRDVDKSLWSEKRVSAYAESLTVPGVPEGLLRIPSLRLEVPIYAGETEVNLDRGAGHHRTDDRRGTERDWQHDECERNCSRDLHDAACD